MWLVNCELLDLSEQFVMWTSLQMWTIRCDNVENSCAVWTLAVCQQPLVPHKQLLVMCHLPLVVCGQLLVMCQQSLVVCEQSLMVREQLLVICQLSCDVPTTYYNVWISTCVKVMTSCCLWTSCDMLTACDKNVLMKISLYRSYFNL